MPISITRGQGTRGDFFYLISYENREKKFAYDTLVGFWQHPKNVPERVREEILRTLPYKSELNEHEQFFLKEMVK